MKTTLTLTILLTLTASVHIALARPPRPVLAPPVYNRLKPHLIVHYTKTGIDSTTDVYAESVAVWAESAWARLTQAGWYPPAPDQYAGGDDRFDIYLMNMVGGLNIPDSNYTDPYIDGVSCWNEVTIDTTPTHRRWRHAVVCHEFGHACHGRCDNYAGSWINEQTACYLTRTAFPGWTELTEWSFARYSPLNTPWFSINSVDTLTLTPGPAALWLAFLDQYYGSNTVRRMWDLMGRHAGENTFYDMDSLLKRDFNSGLDYALGHYAIWRYFTGPRDDNLHFRWPPNESLAACSVHTRHTTFPASGNQGSQAPRGPGGMNVIEFVTDGTHDLNISFDGQDGYRWRAYVLCIRDGVSHEQVMLLNANNAGSILIPTTLAQIAVLIPVVLDRGSSGYITPPLTYTYNASLVDDPTGFKDKPPTQFTVSPSSPNPMRTHAKITYTLPKGIKGNLAIMDVKGRLVQKFELVGDGLTAKVIWNKTDRVGKKVSPGVYFYRLSAGANTIRNKIIVE